MLTFSTLNHRPEFVDTVSTSHTSPPWELSPVSVPVIQSLEALSQLRAITAAFHSDSVPSSGQKVRCVLPCYGVCGYVCPRERLVCMTCSYVGIVGVSTVRRTE